MVGIDTTIAGTRYGDLTATYTKDRGRDVACRCLCGRLVHVAAAALADGTITSCGCRSPSPAFWKTQKAMRAQLVREINFAIAKAR